MKLRTYPLVAVFCIAATLISCGSNEEQLGLGGQTALQTETETETPTETEAPTDSEAPTDTEAPPDSTEDPADEEGSDGGGSANLIIIALAMLLIGAVAYLAFRAARPKSGPARSGSLRVPSIGPDDRVLGDISWLNDQLSLELMSAPPDEALQRWRNERPRIAALTRECQRLEESSSDPMWGALAGEVATLAQALDTATMARAEDDVDPTVVRQSIDLVNRHRSQLAGLSTQVRHR